MRAAVLHGKNDLRYQEVATPHAGLGEVVVRVKACGICAIDVKILAGDSSPRILPTILGHEVAGLVHELGDGVEEFGVGQRVATYPIASCGECFYCRQGRHNLCINEFGLAHGADGGFAEYVKIPRSLVKLGGVVPIGDSLTFELAAMAEPLSCCLSAFRSAALAQEAWVVIVGAGPLGLLHLLTARSQGLRTIVADIIPERLETAREIGAELVIDSAKSDPVSAIQSATGIGADLVIMALGAPEVIEKSLPLVRKGGIFNIFGGPPRGSRLTIDPRWLHYGEIVLTGTSGSTLADYQRALCLIANGEVDVRPVISHRVGLDDLLDTVEKVRKHEVLKAIMLM
jgi:L-iditol 2-dehydrogenase